MSKHKKDLDLRKLEVFFWVAELRSFSQAAEKLSLRQPTVSAHVLELEEQLGAKVLDRAGGQVAPTALGRMLLEKARAMLNLKEDTMAALDNFQGRVKGDLLIGGSNIPGEYILPRKLGAFVRKYPEVKPVLRIGDSAGIVEEVLEGKVELGFVGFKGGDGRLSFQKIWKDEMILAVPKGHPWCRLKAVELKDLRSQGFISREGGSGTLRSLRKVLIGRGKPPEKTLNVIMELGSTEAVKEALIAGLGVSILSRTSILREIQNGLLKEISIRGLKLERDFYQVFHHRRPRSTVCQAFVHFLRK